MGTQQSRGHLLALLLPKLTDSRRWGQAPSALRTQALTLALLCNPFSLGQTKTSSSSSRALISGIPTTKL